MTGDDGVGRSSAIWLYEYFRENLSDRIWAICKSRRSRSNGIMSLFGFETDPTDLSLVGSYPIDADATGYLEDGLPGRIVTKILDQISLLLFDSETLVQGTCDVPRRCKVVGLDIVSGEALSSSAVDAVLEGSRDL
jgi:hypothetical protein